MAEPKCILCGSSELAIRECVATRILKRWYSARLRVDTSADFGDVHEIQLLQCGRCDLSFFWPQTPGGGEFYEQLMHYPWYYLPNKTEYAYAAETISPGARVLEVGCGRGAFVRYLKDVEYHGIELNPAAAAAAKAQGLNVSCTPLEAVAAECSGRYDVVCAFQVLEHVADLRAFLQHCIGATKVGGTLIFSVPSADSYVGAAVNGLLNMPPHHMTWWTDSALSAVGRSLPIQLERLEHEGLSNLHRRAYIQTVVTRAINARLRRLHRVCDDSVVGVAVHFSAHSIARFLTPGLDYYGLTPRGHTVTAVYRRLI